MLRNLSGEELERLKSLYPNTTNPELASLFNVKLSWLEKFATTNGLKKRRGGAHQELPKGFKCESLEVLNKTNKKAKNNTLYLCRCSCGRELLVRSTLLRRGKATACGRCTHEMHLGQNHHRRGGLGPIGGSVWSKFKSHAHERGIPFRLTIEEAVQLFNEQDGRCALSGLELWFPTEFKKVSSGNASLDRIDSNGCYELGNVRWVEKRINQMRNKHDDDTFFMLCEAVVEHRRLKMSEKSEASLAC